MRSTRSTKLRGALNQVAVRWPDPVPDGEGGRSFGDPVEIDCRWEEKRELVTDATGKERQSMAVIYVAEDVAEGDMLFLAGAKRDFAAGVALAALSSAVAADPFQEPLAHEVIAFKKVPTRDGTGFWRTAWL